MKRDIRALLDARVCRIERTACPILLETRRKWWDRACAECEMTRAEQLPEIGPWTLHVLQLKFELDECRIPYGVDDLSPDEWHYLGIVSREIKIIESEQRQKDERIKRQLHHPSTRPAELSML
ncbi:MAG: hypothetical protein ACE5G9_10055 [Nitrospinales bacterium]